MQRGDRIAVGQVERQLLDDGSVDLFSAFDVREDVRHDRFRVVIVVTVRATTGSDEHDHDEEQQKPHWWCPSHDARAVISAA